MPNPSGTVTFLFTDIEGSTKLWEAHPEAMRLALARHDDLLRQAIAANEGTIFKTVGDAFCAAFATAPDALKAALAAQCALHAEVWPEAIVLRVRMALHTGAAEYRDNDYFGQPLNRIARLLSVGHGGQTLLSDVAHDLTRDTLPSLVSLLPLGEHRLRDLGRPETIFQLLHPDLPAEFPPLRSLDNPALPNNLPQQVTSFIGREKEIETVKTLLSKTRLLTLTGSGGCGKTRLGLQVAAEVLDTYPDGAWLIELASLADPALVPQAVASVLGVREEAGKPLTQTLVAALKDKKMLLVLDNCEHLLTACALLVDALLRACPHVQVLASSREGLGIAGETVYRIPSLSLPDRKQTATPTSLAMYEAVRLFVDRAMAAQPAFAVTNANAPAVASVCHRLDGIPLAIELSAARVRSLSVEEINSKLDNRFRLLTGGSRTALPRQQTLRALIDWSYDLLNDQEKALLCRLSVFAGGWTLEAAEAVGIGEDIEDWEILDLLTSLADKSLVVAEPSDEQTRYRLLETVRQYARDRLVESGEGEGVRERHQAFFVRLAEEAEPLLQGLEQLAWLDRLESEHDNLRAALEWNNQETALRIAGALWWFWNVRGYYTEGRKWLGDTLASAVARASTPARAKALNAAGSLAWKQGDYAVAQALHEESLALHRAFGNKQGIADALSNLGNVAYSLGDNVAAQGLHRENLALFQELGDTQGIANTLISLGSVAGEQGDYLAARTLFEESLSLHRAFGNKQGIAGALSNLGIVAHSLRDYAAAQGLYRESLALFQELGHKQGIANSLNNMGVVTNSQGDYLAAQGLYKQNLTLCRELGDKQGIISALNNLGMVTHSLGDYAAAQGLYRESLALFQELGHKQGIANSLNNMGLVAYSQSDYLAAQGLYEQSLTLCRELGDKQGIANTLNNLGSVAGEQGDYLAARSLNEQSLALYRELGDKQGIAYSLEAFAALALAAPALQQALHFWGASEALREEIGAPLTPFERLRYDGQVAQARSAMDEEAFALAWAQGRALTMEQAIAYTLKGDTDA